MSTIAQKLCAKVVEPASKTSTANIAIETSWRRPRTNFQNKPTRSIIIEKQKIINKLVPRASNLCDKGHAVINQFKSKETILKKLFTDTGINTTESGTPKSDSQCVTSIRKRDGNYCRCSPRRNNNCQVTSQEIQTLDRTLIYRDRASSRTIEQSTRSTQVLGKVDEVKVYCSIGLDARVAHLESNQITKSEKKIKSSHSIMGARRWSLSKYAQRGPDF